LALRERMVFERDFEIDFRSRKIFSSRNHALDFSVDAPTYSKLLEKRIFTTRMLREKM